MYKQRTKVKPRGSKSEAVAIADAHKTATRLIRRLQQMGYAVQLTPA